MSRLQSGNGYKDGEALFLRLGGGWKTYKSLKRGNQIGYEFVRELYNEFGALTMLEVIDLQGETIQSFKSKFVAVGGYCTDMRTDYSLKKNALLQWSTETDIPSLEWLVSFGWTQRNSRES